MCIFPAFLTELCRQNSITEEGSRVSSIELELRFSETLTHIESAIVSSSFDLLLLQFGLLSFLLFYFFSLSHFLIVLYFISFNPLTVTPPF